MEILVKKNIRILFINHFFALTIGYSTFFRIFAARFKMLKKKYNIQ